MEVRLRLTADATGLTGTVRVAREELEQLGQGAGRGARGLGEVATGADRARQGLRGVAGDAKGAESSLVTMGQRVQGLAAGWLTLQAAVGGVRFAEAFTGAQSRLDGVIQSSEQLAAAQDDIFASAQRTGSSLVGTSDLVGTLTRNLKEAGNSTGDAISAALGVAETINQTIALGGQTAQASEAALVQFLKGLNNGTFQAEELNSVLDGAPALALALAKALDTTTGGLKKLAAEGKLTSASVIEALQQQAGAVDEQFSRGAASATRGWQRALNSIQREVGDFYSESGLDRFLENALGGGGEAIAEIIRDLRDTAAETRQILEDTFDPELFQDFGDRGGDVFSSIGFGIANMVDGARDLFTLLFADIDARWTNFLLLIERSKNDLQELAPRSSGLVGGALRNAARGINQVTGLEIPIPQPTAAGDRTRENQLLQRYQDLRKLQQEVLNGDNAILRMQERARESTERRAAAEKAAREEAAKGPRAQAAAAAAAGAAESAAAKQILDSLKRQQQARDQNTRAIQQQNAEIDRQRARLQQLEEARGEFLADAFESQRDRRDLLEAATPDAERTVRAYQAARDAARRYRDILLDIAQAAGKLDDAERARIDRAQLDFQERFESEERDLQRLERVVALRDARRDSTFGAVRGEDDQIIRLDRFEDLLAEAVRAGFADADLSSFFGVFEAGLERALQNPIEALASVLQFAAPIIQAAQDSNGNSVGSGFRALSQQLANSPNPYVAAAAQTANMIDQLTRGRLFGTDWQRTGGGFNAGITGAGVTGNQFINEERQRSLFRGRRFQTTSSALDSGTQDALEGLFDAIEAQLARDARRLGTTGASLVEGAFSQTVDAQGRVLTQVSRIAGQIVSTTEDFEDFQLRLTATNRLAVVALSAGADVTDAIAARWLDSADLLAQGADLLLAAQADIVDGNALLRGDNALTRTADLIEDLAQAGEPLVEAYTRAVGASALLEQQVRILGVSLESGSEAFVTFATAIAEAAGGLDNARALTQRFYEGFFSDAERLQFQLDEALQRRGRLANEIGVDPTIEAGAFRALFSQVFSSLTPEQIVRFYEFGDALLDVNETLGQLAEGAGSVDDALAGANAAFADFVSELDGAFNDAARLRGSSDYLRQQDEIGQWTSEQIARANQLARAQGLQGASTETLARITQIASVRLADAARALEAGLVQDIRSLYQSQIDQRRRDLEALGDWGALMQRNQQPTLDPDRFFASTSIAERLRQLGEVRGEGSLDIAERLGLPLRDFLTDLGVNFQTIFESGSFDAFAAAARTLGVELPDFAERFGVEIGRLEDRDSAINDAFERALATADKGTQERLRALLADLEGAGTDQERADARFLLVEFISGLSPALQALFAPFLDEVDTTSFEDAQVNAVNAVETAVREQSAILSSILAVLSEQSRGLAKAAEVAPGTVQAVSDEAVAGAIADLSAQVASIAGQVAGLGGLLSQQLDYAGIGTAG
jgi:tape measure domain-containing protein